MTTCGVITHRIQYKISCKIHFRMVSKTRVLMCAILEPQLQLFWNFCTNRCLFTWFILSLCQFVKNRDGSPTITKLAIEFEFAMRKWRFNDVIAVALVYSTLNPQIFRSPISLVYMCTSIILPIRRHLCSVPLVSAFLRPKIHQVYGLFLDQSISSMASKHKRRTREFRKSSSIHNSRASKQH